jgi:cytoskeletal protein CcmA (bactofilin family)
MADRPTEIGATIVVRGELTAREDIVISGRVEGTIHSEGQLVTVKQGAEVEADALAREIRVAGKVSGSLSAKERICLEGTADVEGEMSSAAVVLTEGAVFHGTVETTGDRKSKLQLAS